MYEENTSEEGRNMLWDLFATTLRQEFKCAAHFLNNCENTYGTPIVYTACLPLPAKDSESLQKSLNMILSEEKDRERKCRHKNCKSDIADVVTQLEKLPSVFILQLQRFRYTDNGAEKLGHKMTIPTQLEPYPGAPSYILTGAVVHVGPLASSGHYVALVRCPQSGKIIEVNDSNLPRYDVNGLLDTAYMLIYSKEQETMEAIENYDDEQNLGPANKKMRMEKQSEESMVDRSDRPASHVHTDTVLEETILAAKNVTISSNPIVTNTDDMDVEVPTHKEDILTDSLPTPPYTSINKQSLDESHKHTKTGGVIADVQNEGVLIPDIDKMSREWLINYCCKNIPSIKPQQQNTKQLRNSVNTDVLRNIVEKVNDDAIDSVLKDCSIKPNKNKEKRRAQVINHIKKADNKIEICNRLAGLCISQQQPEEDMAAMAAPYTSNTEQQSTNGSKSKRAAGDTVVTDSLPTPPYTSITKQTEEVGEPDIYAWMAQFPNLVNMTRENLQDYCRTYIPTISVLHPDTTRLQHSVFTNMFTKFLDNIIDEKLGSIFKHYGIKPDIHIVQRRGQLKRFFSNAENKIEILTWMMQKSGPQNAENAGSTTSYINDFFPENLDQIMGEKNQLKVIRQHRIQTGEFEIIQPNPILEAGREMCDEMRGINVTNCRICKEEWPDMKIGPKNQKCTRCANERLPAGIPPTFSPENDMDPGEQPQCLQILNTVEQAAVSLICPITCIYKLRGGGSKLKGHSISFPQDVQQFVRSLPRRPEDLPFIVIKAPQQNMPLTANRHNILNAITWLTRHNPEYAHINIDIDAANMYPENRNIPVQNIPTYCDPDAPPEHEEDGQNLDSHADLDDDDLVETVAPCGVPTLAQFDQIRSAFGAGQQQQNCPQATVDWPMRGEQPASEWEPGYFSKAFPHLFPYGSADITKPRIGKQPEFLAYLRHLTRLPYTRFAADERFVLHGISMFRRHKALTLGNVYASNVCRNMSLSELKEKVTEDDDTIMKSLVAFSSQIPGTKGHFAQESKKAVAMEQWIRIMSENKEMLNTFLTFSLPDFHMEELHRLLPGSDQYLGKIVVPKMSDVPPDANADDYIDEKTDFLLRKKALKENGNIVDFFGQKKLDVLVKKILHDTLGIVDYVIRAEYQSRSAVHWHMAGRMLGVSMTDIVKACKKYKFDVRETTDEEMTEEDLEEQRLYFVREGVIMDHPDTEEFRDEVAASRERVIDFSVLDLGLSACHPQRDPKLWPGPEGQNVSKPPTNCLRTNFRDVIDIIQDYEMIVNRVQLHSCRITYCLKKILESYRCRFGFPLTLKGFLVKLFEAPGASSIWDELERLEDFQSGAEFEDRKIQLLRNHPRIVVHVPEIALIWRGNTEAKMIDCPKAFVKYISKYMLKPEVPSLPFKDIVKTLTLNAEDNTPVRKIFQKIMMKLVSEHDMSKNECWKVISGKHYVTYSRPFRYLNLTGSRRVNLEANDNPEQLAVAKNFCDIYWSKETDEKYLAFVDKYESGLVDYPRHPKYVSLYEFAGNLTSSWQPSRKLYIPKPTPCFTYVPIPENEDFRKAYCETTLLLHKPGATPHNLLDSHENVEDAMLDFVSNNERCPKAIKEEFLASLKMTAAELENMNNNVEDLVASGASRTGNMEQDDWMLGLGGIVRPTDIMEEEPTLMDDEEDFLDLEPNEDVDWSTDRIELGLSNTDIDEATDWIPRMKVSADLEIDSNTTVHPDDLNIHQRLIFDKMMSSLEEDQPQRLIDVSGAAGSGKSFMINAILQKAQENTGHRNSVKIAAPTGSAGSHFPDGQTIHCLLKIPSKKGCGELDDLSGGSLAALQESFKHTKAIIIDEKGMVGLGRLSQIDARLKQAKPQAADKPFGGITILLAGDLRQLQPVGDLPLYSDKGGHQFQQRGRLLYRLFDDFSYKLYQQMRQLGAENEEFKEQLERLATGQFTIEDWKTWSKHDIATKTEDERNLFIHQATMLCAMKRDMLEFNLYHLKRTGHPIARLKAENSQGASAFNADHAQGLNNRVYLSRGAKVVLTSNLWTAAKLVNGSQGTVEFLVFKEGNHPSTNLPDLVICKFPEYCGPSFVPNQEKLVPLIPQRATWFEKGEQYSRTQYPLIHSWALTIHKSQGLFKPLVSFIN